MSGAEVSIRGAKATVITSISGDIVQISGQVVTVSGQTVSISGNLVLTSISGNLVLTSISGNTVLISGQTVSIAGGVSISGNLVSISGQPVSISGQPIVISGQPVSISGQPIVISGQPVSISGQPIVISGQPVSISGQPVVISGQVVNISGQPVVISGQVVNISGQTSGAIVLTSGQVANISGQPVSISGQPVVISGQIVSISGQTVSIAGGVSISGNLVSISGQPVSISGQPVIVISGDIDIDRIHGVIDSNNTTTVPLGPGAIFTGIATETIDFSEVRTFVFADQNSANLGLSLQASTNNINWDSSLNFNVQANTGAQYTIGPRARYFRVVYTNGSITQGISGFRLLTVLKPTMTTWSVVRMADTVSFEAEGQLVKAGIFGKTTAGGGSYVDVKVSPSGAIQVGGEITVISGSVVSVSGNIVNISGQVVNVSGQISGAIVLTSGQVANISGQLSGTTVLITNPALTLLGVSLSGQTITTAGGATNISGQMVSISGQPVEITDTAGSILDLIKQNDLFNAARHGIISFGLDTITVPNRYRQYTTDADGDQFSHLKNLSEVKINPSTEDTLASINAIIQGSGGFNQTVIISGQPIATSISGNIVNTSGQVANISGQISGAIVLTSGQVANISGQISGAIVLTSGHVANISGQISGAIVLTSGHVANISGQISGTIILTSGQVSNISGQEVTITPVLNVNIHNTTITPNIFILSNAITPTKLVSLFRVQAAMTFAGVLSVSTSDGGKSGTVTAATFNQNVSLISSSLYIFDHLTHSGESVNYAYSTSSLVINFHVQEMPGGVY